MKVVQELLGRCAHDVVYLVDLVELVVTWEEREEAEDFEEYAASSPDIHFVAIVAIS